MEYGSMETVLCTSCGLLYRYPVVTDEEISNYYQCEYYEQYQDDSSRESRSLKTAREKNERLLWYLQAKIDFNNKRVLDAGCGRGILLEQLAKVEDPSYLVGLEPSESMVKWIKGRNPPFEILCKTISDYVEQFESLKKPLPRFDVILLVGVFEHLSNPLKELMSLRKLVAKKGIIYIYTHNEEPTLWWNPNERISLVHVLYMTRQTIDRLLFKAGFRIVSLATKGTGMHVFAVSCDSHEDVKMLTQKEYENLYYRYQFTKTKGARAFRFCKQKIIQVVRSFKRLAKVVLSPWLSKIQIHLARRYPW